MITPTQYIREIALKTGQAQAPRKIVEYQDIEYQEVKDAYCWLCGGETQGKGIPVSKAIKPTFMDHDRARRKDSESICQGCSFCLAIRTLRNYSILVTENYIKHPGRDEWRKIIFSPPEPPFLAILAVSGQKHLHFKSEIACSKDHYPIMLEEMKIIVSRDKLNEIITIFEILYSNGFTKTEIDTGNYKQHRIMEFGLGDWASYEDKIGKYRGSGLFNLASYIAQEKDGLKIEKEKGSDYIIKKLKPGKENNFHEQMSLF